MRITFIPDSGGTNMKDDKTLSKQRLADEDLENVAGGSTYYWQKKSADDAAQLLHVDENGKPDSWVLYGADKPAGEGKTVADIIKKGKGTGWEPNSGLND